MEINSSPILSPRSPLEVEANSGLGSVFSQGVSGLRSAGQELLGAAKTIASAGSGEDSSATLSDIASALIDQRKSLQFFDASAKVVSVADELSGKIINDIV